MKLRAIVGLSLIAMLPALVQAAPQQKTDPAKEAAIRRLIEITGGKKMMDQVVAQMLAQLRPELLKTAPPGARGQQIVETYLQKFQARASRGELVEQMIPIYDKYFSQADIEGLIQFYQSPLGQRFLQVMPQIVGESTMIGMRWGQKIVQEVQQEMEAEFPELKQGQRPAPPQP